MSDNLSDVVSDSLSDKSEPNRDAVMFQYNAVRSVTVTSEAVQHEGYRSVGSYQSIEEARDR